MKKFICLVIALLVASSAYGATTNLSVTSNTVSFNTVGTIVTLNTVSTALVIKNDSSSAGNVYITLESRYLGWNNDMTSYAEPQSTNGTVMLKPGTTLTTDFSTDQFGWKCDNGFGTIEYIAVSDTNKMGAK